MPPKLNLLGSPQRSPQRSSRNLNYISESRTPPTPWVVRFSRTVNPGIPYYFNSITNETQWEFPENGFEADELNLGEASLGEESLGEARLREASLGEESLGEARLREARLQAYLREARLREARLREGEVVVGHLRDARLGEVYLGEAVADEALLGEGVVDEERLREERLRQEHFEAILREAIFGEARVDEARVDEARLRLGEARLAGPVVRPAVSRSAVAVANDCHGDRCHALATALERRPPLPLRSALPGEIRNPRTGQLEREVADPVARRSIFADALARPNLDSNLTDHINNMSKRRTMQELFTFWVSQGYTPSIFDYYTNTDFINGWYWKQISKLMTNKGVHSYYDVENFYKNTPEFHNSNQEKIATFLSEVDKVDQNSYPVKRQDDSARHPARHHFFQPPDDSDDDLYA